MRPIRLRRGAFTLIELVVVIVLIGIVSLIGAYSLGAFGQRFNQSTAVASIYRVITAEHSFAETYGTYSSWPSDINPGQGITTTDGASTAAGMVSLALGTDGNLGLAAESSNGACTAVGLSSLDGIPPATETTTEVAPSTPCTGAAVLQGVWPGDTPVTPASARS